MRKMSILTEENDLKVVVSTLRQEKFVAQNKITLFGASQGGALQVFMLQIILKMSRAFYKNKFNKATDRALV